MRWLVALTWVLVAVGLVSAQTATPEFSEIIYATLVDGQVTRFEYVATVSDIQIANLLLAIIFSCWGMFIVLMFVVFKPKGKNK